jgi:putative peptidoglycan lipid II flippase
MGYGAGVLGLVGVKVAAPAYYAQQDMVTPMRVAIGALVLTQVLNAVLILGAGMGVAALALSIGLAANANAAVLLWGLQRRGHYRPEPGWGRFALKVVAASVVMGGLMFWMAHRLDWLALGRTEGVRAGAMALALVGSALVYFGVLRLLGLRLRGFMRKA